MSTVLENTMGEYRLRRLGGENRAGCVSSYENRMLQGIIS